MDTVSFSEHRRTCSLFHPRRHSKNHQGTTSDSKIQAGSHIPDSKVSVPEIHWDTYDLLGTRWAATCQLFHRATLVDTEAARLFQEGSSILARRSFASKTWEGIGSPGRTEFGHSTYLDSSSPLSTALLQSCCRNGSPLDILLVERNSPGNSTLRNTGQRW
jgi:hypothetical protein